MEKSILEKFALVFEIVNIWWYYFVIFFSIIFSFKIEAVVEIMKSTNFLPEYKDNNTLKIFCVFTHFAISYFHFKNQVGELAGNRLANFPTHSFSLVGFYMGMFKQPLETIICGRWIGKEHVQTVLYNIQGWFRESYQKTNYCDFINRHLIYHLA